jgi:hypothetical protein
MKYISLPLFLVSFALGILFTYVLGLDLKPVYVYPTPENIQQFLFRDDAGTCFQFISEEVSCKGNEKKIKSIPVQQEKIIG